MDKTQYILLSLVFIVLLGRFIRLCIEEGNPFKGFFASDNHFSEKEKNNSGDG